MFEEDLIFCFSLFSFKLEIRKLSDEIKGKSEQIALLEKQIADSIMTCHNKMDKSEVSQVSLVSLLFADHFCLFIENPVLCFFF